MDTPSPVPAPIEAPTPVPAVPAVPVGPTCAMCGQEAVVHWLRRPTDDELAQLVAVEEARRAEVRQLADPQLPEPVFPALPSSQDTTRVVYACAAHAITLDAASRIHTGSCTAPNEADLPGCDCTPEPPPADRAPEAEEEAPPSRLPASWVTGTS